jgi:hypothetical protein
LPIEETERNQLNSTVHVVTITTARPQWVEVEVVMMVAVEGQRVSSTSR